MKTLLHYSKRVGFVFFLTLLLGFVQKSFGQTAASATWALTSNANYSTSGAVTATSQAFGSNLYNTGYQNGFGVYSQGWPTGSQSSNSYYQFTITPTAGNNLTVTSIGSTNVMNYSSATAIIQYSTSSSFSSPQTVGTSFTVSTSQTTKTFNSLSISVPSGTTLYVRIFSYNTTHSNTDYFGVQNFAISGTTVANSSLTASASSLAFGNQVIGTNSTSQPFTLSGSGLTPASGNITISIPAYYQVNVGSTWYPSSPSSSTTTTTLAYTSGTISSVSIPVRFSPTVTDAAENGNITFNGGGVSSTPSIAVTGFGTGAYSKLQVLLPGETAAPGTASGKSGTATAQTAGTPFTITVNAVDANWYLITNGATSSHTAAISSTDAQAVLPSSNALSSGTQTFNVTLKTAPSQTITATDQTAPIGSPNTSSSVTVNASSATQIALNGGNGQSATAGSAVAIAPSVIVKDAYGNPVSGVSISFAVVTGGGSVGGASATTNTSGLAAVGSWTLGAAAGSNSMSASKSGLTGSPVTFTATGTVGSLAKLQILLPGETAVAGTTTGKTGTPSAKTAGTSFNVVVNGVDANWNIVTSASDVIKITSSDAQAVLPANNSLSSGTKTFPITLKTANSQTVTCSDVTNSSITANTSAAVAVNAASLSTFSFANIGTQSADAPFAITVTAQDAYGNTLSTANGNSFSGSVALSTSITGGTVSPTSLSISNGSYSGNVTAYLAGSQYLQVSYNSGSVTGNSNPFTVSAFASSSSDYFRSASSGDWAATSPFIWQGSHDGTNWYIATAYPTSSAVAVTIQNTHSVAITTAVSSSNLTINGIINVNGASGNLSNSGTITGANVSTLLFGSGATYTHARDAGAIPTASWNANSNCVVSGVSATAPSGLGQGFGNFAWTSNLSNIIDLNGALTTINGNFTFNPNNSNYSLRLATSGTYTLNITGSFLIPSNTNGTIRLSDGSSNPIVYVGGSISIAAANSDLDFGNGSGYGTINVTGNVTLSGSTSLETSGSSTNGIINFKGGTQSLSGSPADINSVNFIINNGSTTTLTTGVTLSSFSVFTVSSGASLIFGTNTITDDDFSSSFVASSGSTLQIGSPQGIVNNSRQYTGGFFGYYYYSPSSGNVILNSTNYNAGANYIYTSTGAQATGNALPATLTGNLVISNTNTSTGVTLSNTAQTINGTINIGPASILTLPAATSTTTFGGAVNTNTTGIINAGTSSALVINGTGTISSPSVFGSNTFSSFTLNRASSLITLGSALKTGSLALTNGKIDASAFVLTVTATPIISGFSSVNYIITGNGSGNGYLQINNLAANTQYTFPVGTTAYYLPANVKPVTGGLNWTSKVFSPVTTNGSYSGYAYSGSALQSIVNAVWDIAPTPDISTTATITVNWVDALEGSVFAGYADSYIGISHYTSGAWQGGTATGGASNSTDYATSTFNSFSPFSVGSINNPLPVVLVGFDAVLNNNKTVDVSWTTEQEVNSSHFEIERSADGTHWQTIGTVQAKGNSSLPSNYGYTDESPLDGINYYRLKMVNIAGDYGYTITRIIRTMQVKGINIFPNPARNFVNVSVSQAATDLNIRLINQSGQVLQVAKINAGGSSTISLQVQNYPQGTYLLQITGADGTQQTSKVIIMR
jgi:type IX secretion system substrate protein